MLLKVTSKRQVTFPAKVLESLGVKPGDHIEIVEGPAGFLLKPKRYDPSMYGYLRDKIDPNAPPFDIAAFRDGTYDSSLRD